MLQVPQQLLEIAQRYGTPTYAFDVSRLRQQADKLRSGLPDEVGVFYSLKANASLGICDVFADCGIGADVASAGELATAVAAGFPPERIFVAGPYKLAETIDQLKSLPESIISVDSLSEFQSLAAAELPNPLVLRLRPDFGSCAVVPAGCESRFGFTDEQLVTCRDLLSHSPGRVIGFHVFAGSQVLDSESLSEHLTRSLELCLRAAQTLGVESQLLNLGGGFGIPYGPNEPELDLQSVAGILKELVTRAAPARIVLELGRYLVAEAGWYLTSVLGHQTYQGRNAIIVDGGTHQRADMCGLHLSTSARGPVVVSQVDKAGASSPTSVLGCLSLPADIMTESADLPSLSKGDVLAYGTAGAYGLWSSPAIFHGSPLPAEVAFDGDGVYLMRSRQRPESILADQHHVSSKSLVLHAN